MESIFIAVNGDNVGDGIGDAIATDNHDELDRITQGIGDAHGAIQEWVESIGGKVVTSSGDEGIYQIPADAYDEDEVDSLREQYSQSSGTTVTIGVGSSMSEASKALIYGKLNEKDQLVEYDPHIEDYIAGEDDDEPEIPSDEELSEQSYEDSLEEEGMGEEVESNTQNNEMEAGGEQDFIPEDEESALVGESSSEETEETQDDEPQPEMNSEEDSLMEEGDVSEDEDDVSPEEKIDDVVSEDGEEISQEDEDSFDEVPPEEAPMEAEDLDGEDLDGEDLDEDEQHGMISDMIHANMEGEEGEDVDPDELKGKIAQALMTFKENKPMLEESRQTNPKLYEATLTMIQSMISMAKQLSMDPMQDIQDQEGVDELPNSEELSPETEGEELDESELVQKYEMAKLYKNLSEGIGILKSMKKADNWREYYKKKEKEKQRRKKMFTPKKGKKFVDHALEELESKMKDEGKKAKVQEEESVEKSDKKKAKRQALKKKDPMSLPDKATKHTPKKQLPVGSVKNGKVRVKDGTTGRITWRSGRSGMSRDWDGDAIATNYNRADMKEHKTHTVHMGHKGKKNPTE